MAGLKTRIQRLEAQAPAARDEKSEREQFARYVDIVLEGFDDVRAWLEGEGPAPDPHRLARIIRRNIGAGIELDEVGYYEALLCVVVVVGYQRTAEQTGHPIPDDLDRAHDWLLAHHDKVTGTLLHNARLWLRDAMSHRAGTLPLNQSSFGEVITIPFIEGECGRDCPYWDESPEAKREYQERLARLEVELKAAGLIP